jgi:hypothetical protein
MDSNYGARFLFGYDRHDVEILNIFLIERDCLYNLFITFSYEFMILVLFFVSYRVCQRFIVETAA